LLQILAGGHRATVICRELLATLQHLALELFADNCKRARRLQSELPGNHLSESNQGTLALIVAFSPYYPSNSCAVCSALVDFPDRFARPQQICARYDNSLARSQTFENRYLAAGQRAGPDWNRLGDRSAGLLLGCIDEITVASRIVHQSV